MANKKMIIIGSFAGILILSGCSADRQSTPFMTETTETTMTLSTESNNIVEEGDMHDTTTEAAVSMEDVQQETETETGHEEMDVPLTSAAINEIALLDVIDEDWKSVVLWSDSAPSVEMQLSAEEIEALKNIFSEVRVVRNKELEKEHEGKAYAIVPITIDGKRFMIYGEFVVGADGAFYSPVSTSAYEQFYDRYYELIRQCTENRGL